MLFNAIARALRPLFLKYQKSEFGVMLLPRFVPSLGKLGGVVGEQHGEWGKKPVLSRAGVISPPSRLGLPWQRRRSKKKSSLRRPQNLTRCTGADRAGTSNSAFGNCFFNSQILNFQVSNFEGNVPASFSIVSDNKKKYDFDVSVPPVRELHYAHYPRRGLLPG